MKQKDNMEAAVRHWLSVRDQHAYETNNFTVDPHTMTEGELLATKGVMHWFLDFAPSMFYVFTKKEHPRLRKMIAYLTELQQLQNEAWTRFIADGERMQQRINNWLKEHGVAKKIQ